MAWLSPPFLKAWVQFSGLCAGGNRYPRLYFSRRNPFKTKGAWLSAARNFRRCAGIPAGVSERRSGRGGFLAKKFKFD